MSGFLLICFTLCWSAGALFFDGLIVRSNYRQYEASSYPTAPGTITHSKVKKERGSKHMIYSADLSYDYRVGSQKYTGHEVRFSIEINNGPVRAIVARYPEGSTVTVYYNPTNPGEAILEPGIGGNDLFGVLFWTPFNAIMIALWAGAFGLMRGLKSRPVAGGVKLIADGATTRVRLPGVSPFWVGFGTTGGLGLISIFAVGAPTGFQPSMPLVISVIAVVYGAGVAVFIWQRRIICSGVDDLVINKTARTLLLPLTFGRKAPITVAIADIETIWVDKVTHTSSKGKAWFTYAPTVYIPRNEASFQKLADWDDKLKADDFAQWLSKEIGVAVELSDQSSRTVVSKTATDIAK